MLLAIDSATRKIGIALYDGVQVIHEAVWESKNYHTVELAPAVQTALKRARLTADDIEVIALTVGPGSYTGLRIGAALAKGLSLARHIPLIGIPTFAVLAAAQPVVEENLAVVLQAGRSRLAVGWYKNEEGVWQRGSDPDLLTAEEFSKKIRKPTLVCGELNDKLRKVLGRKRKNVSIASPANSLRRPAYLAELGWGRWQAGETDDPAKLAPYYLQTGEDIPQ